VLAIGVGATYAGERVAAERTMVVGVRVPSQHSDSGWSYFFAARLPAVRRVAGMEERAGSATSGVEVVDPSAARTFSG
jgi:hypothetical protein